MPINSGTINSFTINSYGFAFSYTQDEIRSGGPVVQPPQFRRPDSEWESTIADVNNSYIMVSVKLNGVTFSQTIENSPYVTPFIAVKNINIKEENICFNFKDLKTK